MHGNKEKSNLTQNDLGNSPLKLESGSVCWLPELVFPFHDKHSMLVTLQGNSFLR
jgi:hemolysin-activating ACP:hemolysin acyltransferase